MVGLMGLSIVVLGVTADGAGAATAKDVEKPTRSEFTLPVEDVVLDDVSADRLVRLPFTGNSPVYYPDGYAKRGAVSPGGGGEQLLLYRNTLSHPSDEVFLYWPEWGIRIADDLVTEAGAREKLSRKPPEDGIAPSFGGRRCLRE